MAAYWLTAAEEQRNWSACMMHECGPARTQSTCPTQSSIAPLPFLRLGVDGGTGAHLCDVSRIPRLLSAILSVFVLCSLKEVVVPPTLPHFSGTPSEWTIHIIQEIYIQRMQW